MQNSLQIAFRGMEPSEAVEARIREKVARLERFDGNITSLQVVVQAPHQHHQHGRLYEVKLNLHLPGDELVISHEGPKNQAHEDVYVALRDAFQAAERALGERSRRREHDRRNGHPRASE